MRAWKRTLILLVLSLAILLQAGVGQAEVIPAHGEGQIGWEAVVLCESLTVRQNRSSSSKAVMKLYYGDRIIVQEAWGGWADCFLGDDVNGASVGWVDSSYLIINPSWYRTPATTPVYAWDDTSAPRVALLSKGTVLPILRDDGEWIVVSLRGASGWIRKTAAERR